MGMINQVFGLTRLDGVLAIGLALTVFALPTCAQAETHPSAVRPVKVFILAGQSNMEGHGYIPAQVGENRRKQGSLEFLAHDPASAKRYATLLAKDGSWRKRDDVFITYLDRKGPLVAGFGADENQIGPELGFGWSVGDAYREPVLLIKCAWGGKSLAVDFRPPSAGPVPYSLGQRGDAEIAKDPTIVGRYYRETLSLVKDALTHIKELVPGSDGHYVISGFGWHQGWNDRINKKFTAEYQRNMGCFIRDMRHDLGVPQMPFVIADTGQGGFEEKDPTALALMQAQAAVAQEPEFKATVACVATRPFWRPEAASPNNFGYHWNCNAETYWLIGQGMGEAMKKLVAHRPASS